MPSETSIISFLEYLFGQTGASGQNTMF